MSEQIHDSAFLDGDAGKAEVVTEVRREAALLKTGALQNAIFNSANFSSIATDEKGVIQIIQCRRRAHAGLHGRRSGEQDHAGRHFRSAGSDRARQGAEPRTRNPDYAGL